MAALEAAAAERRVDHAKSDARIARLKLALELELSGRIDEALQVLAEVRAGQDAEGALQ